MSESLKRIVLTRREAVLLSAWAGITKGRWFKSPPATIQTRELSVFLKCPGPSRLIATPNCCPSIPPNEAHGSEEYCCPSP